MKEANCINRSLSALSDVLFALGDPCGSAHVPYRNSKLTYLLQDALGGSGCKTFLFAQISPEPAEVHESYSTMTFATRVAACVQKGRLRLPSASLAAERSPAAAREKTPPRTPGRAGGALAHGGPPRGTPPPAPCGASPPSRLSDCSLAAASPQTRRGSTAAAPPGARRAGAALDALETPDRRPRFHA
ncbi:unnamed protein product [Prorocentrum cordatum]|uniref:Kinesin motor domain-containing protein n=1 Tax=Prorocentrum cordatum TaxID=2364126 RepID=A0ABN9Y5C9_9DINO|nr:unnamed protein product [Polarella glacialis]